ncbi:hypothetical protein AB0V79_03955 [Mesorhizobium ciceri]|uniref:hypothetical protein n=1 Tax=Mesorhizobium TaxID=68287 RepID=UPI0007A93BC5|nr:hypothetical protein [Mesorhizobium ciceri]AMY01611.1 hypothetical protein A4R29_20590 [Mesorhizobium ciceri biovar biserrulae]
MVPRLNAGQIEGGETIQYFSEWIEWKDRKKSKYALIVHVSPRIIELGGDMTKFSNTTECECVVKIPPQFEKYADAAMLRLQALYPNCRLEWKGGTISIGSSAGIEDQLRKDILYAVYREKIYAETLSTREALVAAVTRR